LKGFSTRHSMTKDYKSSNQAASGNGGTASRLHAGRARAAVPEQHRSLLRHRRVGSEKEILQRRRLDNTLS
jgi:hypothetical protein